MAPTLDGQTAARLRHHARPGETVSDVVNRLLDDSTAADSFKPFLERLTRDDDVNAITLDYTLLSESSVIHLNVYGNEEFESWAARLDERYDELDLDGARCPFRLWFVSGEPEHRLTIPLYDSWHAEFTIDHELGYTILDAYRQRDWNQPLPLTEVAELAEKLGVLDLSLPQDQSPSEQLPLTAYGHPAVVDLLAREITAVTIAAESSDDQSASPESHTYAVRWLSSDRYADDNSLSVVQICPEQPYHESTHPEEGVELVRNTYFTE